MALASSSPAIGAIPSGTNGCGTTITTDERGVAGPQGSGCAMGAYEYEAPSITGVSVMGQPSSPTVTITGSGFAAPFASGAPSCGQSGNDYAYNQLYTDDNTRYWNAGQLAFNCVGLTNVTYTPPANTSGDGGTTQITFGFGSAYGTNGWVLNPGDSFTVNIDGASATVNVPYPPNITSIAPSSGPGAGGTKVVLTGTNLKGTAAVDFGSTPATSYSVNASGTSITAYSPPGAAGTVGLSVTTLGGTATSSFTYLGPTITAVTPASGTGVGGNKVVITGTDLQDATVDFGTNPATSSVVNTAGTSITAVVPECTEGFIICTDDVTLSVTTPGGTATSSYTYLGSIVRSVTPIAGPGAGGTKVTIVGSDLQGAQVIFGSTQATSATVNTAGTKVVAYAPAQAAGAVTLYVLTRAGLYQGTYTYLAPGITAISPASGPTTGDTKVTITGIDLQGASVTFGATAALSATVNAGGTKITAYSPPGTAGTVNIVVTTPGGPSATTPHDQYTYQGT